jgi:hypothetical protein
MDLNSEWIGEQDAKLKQLASHGASFLKAASALHRFVAVSAGASARNHFCIAARVPQEWGARAKT